MSHFSSTYKSGAVIIPDSLGISEGLENWVGLHHLILKGRLAPQGLAGGANGREVSNDLLRVLGLSGARLAAVCNFLFMAIETS